MGDDWLGLGVVVCWYCDEIVKRLKYIFFFFLEFCCWIKFCHLFNEKGKKNKAHFDQNIKKSS